jgi:hypothetical protein
MRLVDRVCVRGVQTEPTPQYLPPTVPPVCADDADDAVEKHRQEMPFVARPKPTAAAGGCARRDNCM